MTACNSLAASQVFDVGHVFVGGSSTSYSFDNLSWVPITGGSFDVDMTAEDGVFVSDGTVAKYVNLKRIANGVADSVYVGSPSMNIPEPTTACLLAVGLALLTRQKRLRVNKLQ